MEKLFTQANEEQRKSNAFALCFVAAGKYIHSDTSLFTHQLLCTPYHIAQAHIYNAEIRVESRITWENYILKQLLI